MSQPTQSGRVGGDRERVLALIRGAMSTPTDPHVRHAPLSLDRATYGNGLPPVGDSIEARLASFAARCEALKARLIVVDDRAAAIGSLRTIVDAEPDVPIASQRADRVTPLVEAVAGSRERVCVDDRPDGQALERCGIGISGCFALIAQTGSVLVTSADTGGRALSVLPPHHVVLATIDQLLPTLPSAFAAFRERGGDASMLSFISGPSRTGDIERILVLGAHGPKRLTILLHRSAE